MKGIAVIGAGRWGKNHIRTFYNLPNCDLRWVIDTNAQRRADVEIEFPNSRVILNIDHALSDPEVSGIVIATPSHTHFELAKLALESGKDILVEKPISHDPEEVSELIALARANKLILMVGHLMIYHPAVTVLRNLIRSGELGKIYYIYCQRLNLGTIRTDENCIWSLAPHDISMIIHLMGELPIGIGGKGVSYIKEGNFDTAFINLEFQNNKMAHIHVSWLDPHKTRKITIVGSEQMAVFDDTEPLDKIKIYDKGVEDPDYSDFGESMNVRFGDISVPQIPMKEPLLIEAEHFIECIETRQTPLTNGYNGLAVVNILKDIDNYINNQY